MLTFMNIIIAFVLLLWLVLIAYAVVLDWHDWQAGKKDNASVENR